MGMTLFPWQALCQAHPLGHEHHDHDGPSPCEQLREKQKQHKETAFWSDMECVHFSAFEADYETQQTKPLKFSTQQMLVALILLDVLDCSIPSSEFISQPETRSNSDPPIVFSISHRGPPQSV